MANQLFVRKSIETLLKEMEGENRLHRVLGPVSLTSLGVGAIIGAGIFAMTGQVAAEASGPAVIISYIVAGLGCAFAALCYAEIAAMVLRLVPFAGGHFGQESLHLRGVRNELAVEVARVPVDQHAAEIEHRHGGAGRGLFRGHFQAFFAVIFIINLVNKIK